MALVVIFIVKKLEFLRFVNLAEVNDRFHACSVWNVSKINLQSVLIIQIGVFIIHPEKHYRTQIRKDSTHELLRFLREQVAKYLVDAKLIRDPFDCISYVLKVVKDPCFNIVQSRHWSISNEQIEMIRKELLVWRSCKAIEHLSGSH